MKIFETSAKELKIGSNLELSVNLVEENRIQELNKQYRDKDKPTDVLSFPLGDGNGDIFICLSIAKNEAKSENINVEDKLAQLVVHGFLHLQGYDHQTDEEEKEMTKLERKILDKLN